MHFSSHLIKSIVSVIFYLFIAVNVMAFELPEYVTNIDKSFNQNPDSTFLQIKRMLENEQFNKEKTAFLLNRIGVYYSDKNSWDTALIYLDSSLNLAKNLDHLYLEATNLLDAGLIYDYMGNFDKALDYYLTSLKLIEENSFDAFKGRVYSLIGIIYKLTGDFDNSLYYQRLTIKASKQQKDTTSLARGYNNIANLFNSREYYDSAAFYYNKSLLLCEELNIQYGAAITEMNLGAVYQNLNKFEVSYRHFKKSLHLFQRINDIEGEIEAYKYLSGLKRTNYEPDSAVYFLRKSLQYVNEDVYAITKQSIYEEAYKVYKMVDSLQLALKYYEKYNQLSDSLFNLEQQKEISRIKQMFEVEKKELELQRLQSEKEKGQLINLGIGGLFIFTLMTIWLLSNRRRLKQKVQADKLTKQKLEIERRLLRAQMNPHFLFNSLNAIQGFISENDTIDAERYLARFSRLMRKILDHTMEEVIPVKDEMEALQLYLELEQLRFNNSFDFNIHADESVYPDEHHLPPLLIQPVVENAILHGIRHLKKRGLIEIEFLLANNNLTCIVRDNGIGRKASAEINQKKNTQHVSRGMQVTRDRLAKMTSNGNEGMVIHDLKAKNGQPAGTEVIITIPIEDQEF